MKEDLRVMKTKRKLQEALLELLREKPLEEVNISELCRRAKINRGTFYLHYDGVHDLFRLYVEEIMADLRMSYEEPFYQTNYQIELMQDKMIKIFNHVKNHQSFYQIIFDEKIPMMYYYILFRKVKDFMLQSMELMDIPEGISLDYLSSYHTNALIGMLLQWHQTQYTTPIDQLNKELTQIISMNSHFRK